MSNKRTNEEEEVVVPETEVTDVAVSNPGELMDFADLPVQPRSAISYMKAPRGMAAGENAGKVLIGTNAALTKGNATGMIILAPTKQGWMTYSYFRGEDKKMRPFHYETREEAIEKLPEDAGIEATFDWTPGPSGKNVGPTIVPTADLAVLVETENGYLNIDGRFWEPARLSCTKVEYNIVSSVFEKVQIRRARDPKFQAFQIEWSLSLKEDGNSNHWMQTAAVKVYDQDSKWCQDLIETTSNLF